LQWSDAWRKGGKRTKAKESRSSTTKNNRRIHREKKGRGEGDRVLKLRPSYEMGNRKQRGEGKGEKRALEGKDEIMHQGRRGKMNV